MLKYLIINHLVRLFQGNMWDIVMVTPTPLIMSIHAFLITSNNAHHWRVLEVIFKPYSALYFYNKIERIKSKSFVRFYSDASWFNSTYIKNSTIQQHSKFKKKGHRMFIIDTQ